LKCLEETISVVFSLGVNIFRPAPHFYVIQKMIYIHGVNHNTQHRGNSSDAESAIRLEIFVEDFYGKKNISIVAEEFSEEACEYSGVKTSVCLEISERYPLLRHIYCDPSSSERRKLGIPSQAELVKRVKKDLGVKIVMGKESNEYYDRLRSQYHDIREKFWLAKLEPYKGQKVLFICGSDHVASFSAMLLENDWTVDIV
jgi:hypothetical protein